MQKPTSTTGDSSHLGPHRDPINRLSPAFGTAITGESSRHHIWGPPADLDETSQ